MKRCLWATVVGYIVLSSGLVWAKSMYITDRIEVAVRSSLGIEQKFIGTIKTGDKVDVLEGDQKWSKVRLSNGTVGWVASQFLVDTLRPIAPAVDPKAQEELKSLKDKVQSLVKQQEVQQRESDKLQKQVEDDKKVIQALQQEKMTRIAPELSQLKARNDQLEKQVTEFKQKAAHWRQQQDNQVLNEQIMWFLAGSGVLFVGLLLGWLVSRGKKKTSRYY